MRILDLLAAALACGALVLGPAPATAEFRLEPGVTLEQSYSDNIDQLPDGAETGSFVTDLTPAATLRWSGARVTSSVDLSMTASNQTDGLDKGVTVEPGVAGLVTVEAVREHLFLEGSAAVSPVLLDSREQDTRSNRSIVQTYSASPRLVGNFGGFANADANYRFDQVISDDSGGTDSLGSSQTHTVAARLSSGPDFAKLLWSLIGEVSESKRDDDDDVSRRDVRLDLEYVVDRSFSILGSGGYQVFDDGDTGNDIDDPTWNVGFRWHPGPRTDFTATYGQRDKETSLAADLRYRISPQTSLFATYSEVLETGQERFVRDLSSIGTDPDTGALIDTRTGLPFDPATSSTSVDEDTRRVRTFATGLTGVRGRNTFGATGSVEFTEDESGAGDDEDGYNVDLFWGRQLSPRARIDATAGYARNEFKLEDRDDNEYNATLGYSYSIYTNIRAFAGYSYTRKESTDDIDSFVENVVTLGIGATF